MAKINIIQYAVNEVDFWINYIADNIESYGISELTNKLKGDIPSINNAHPLALEYGAALTADNHGDYTSALPAIGVELLDDQEFERQPLGRAHKPIEITQAWLNSITAIALKDRIANQVIMSTANATAIQAAITAKGTEKLWGVSKLHIQRQSVNISLWSDSFDVTRIVYIILRDVLKRAKTAFSIAGGKQLMMTGQGALYNYDFDRTLFGAEFNLNFLNTHQSIEIDTDLVTIKHVEEYISKILSGGVFTSIGGVDKYPVK